MDVQHGEQPLKRVAARRPRESTLDPDNMDAADDDNAGTALYAPYQTAIYTAPPVVKGQIPKNVYGNLDVYVPSMVPPGGAHIPHQETARAARIVGVDYADAVTGFSFKGRHGTAITSGAVVAAEYREAVEEVIKAFEDEQAQAEEERRSLAALKMWKRFLAGLRIKERIEGYDVEGERGTAMRNEMEKAEDEDEDEGGGFLPDRDADQPAQPTAKAMPTRNSPDVANDYKGGSFFAAEDEQEEIEATYASDRFVHRVNDDDDDDGGGGGFLLDDDDQDAEEVLRDINDDDREDTKHDDNEKSADHIFAGNDDQDMYDEGGGFLPDDSDTRDENTPVESTELSDPERGILDKYSSTDPRDTPQDHEQFEEAFPGLPACEMEEARILQQLYETRGVDIHPATSGEFTAPGKAKSPEPAPMQETTTGGEWVTSAHPSEANPCNESVTEEDPEPDSSEEEKGSLLSHDPDDEDADPEWLA